jgi:hypothetical protein
MRGGTLVTVIMLGVHALIASLITASPHGDYALSARAECAECGVVAQRRRVKTDDRGEDVASFRACIHERKNLIFRT